MRRVTAALALTLGIALDAHATRPGDAAPAFALPMASGQSVSLASLQGKVVYVDFWASWCTPCRRSFPWMNAMQAQYGSAGLAIVGVDVDKRRDDASRFLADTPAAFTIVYDPAGATPTAYDVKGMPSSYLVDRKGNVVAVEEGFHDERREALEALIRAELAKR